MILIQVTGMMVVTSTGNTYGIRDAVVTNGVTYADTIYVLRIHILDTGVVHTVLKMVSRKHMSQLQTLLSVDTRFS